MEKAEHERKKAMKLKCKIILAAVVFYLSLTPVFAHEGGEKHDEMKEAMEMQKTGNVPDILKEINEHESHLQTLIQNGQLDQVHEIAFMIRDLSKSVQEKSEGLSSIDHDKVKSSVTEIAQIADRLDEYGDSGNKVKTEKEVTHLHEALKTLHEQFPK